MKIDTRHKIQLATIAYRIVSFIRRRLGKCDDVRVKRGGILWDIDLHEGIDFSIFLLGGFEPGTLKLYKKLLGKMSGEIVIDIGANIGADTLPLAQLVVPVGGKVFAFEPTDYAYGKLLRNIELNPTITGSSVEAVQAMLVAEDGVSVDQEIYSSWPLVNGSGLHADHHGELKTTKGAQTVSLDSFVRMRGIQRIDFIKLDVDGHEPDVLRGAESSLRSFHPTILMEWSPNLFTDDAMHLALSRLLEIGYELFDGTSGKFIQGGPQELDRRTPHKGSMNILLKMQKK